MSVHLSGRNTSHHTNGVLHHDSYVPYLYYDHCCDCNQGTNNLQEGSRRGNQLHRNNPPYPKSCHNADRRSRKYSVRHIHEHPECIKLLDVSRNIQTADRKIFRNHIHKWIFLSSAIVSAPISVKGLVNVGWTEIPSVQYAELAYLTICATFISYFLIPVAQKRIRPTLVSMYTYVQPIIAIVFSITIGMDALTWQKILAAAMVFGGLVIVSYSKSKAFREQLIFVAVADVSLRNNYYFCNL